jgi:hypothetical protein
MRSLGGGANYRAMSRRRKKTVNQATSVEISRMIAGSDDGIGMNSH